MTKRTAIIIGAGPAGLTAALELLRRSDIHPIVLERSQIVGGIACTINHNGNRIDIGGHRFFSKSDRVMDWWFDVMPMQRVDDPRVAVTYQRQTREVAGAAAGPDPQTTDRVMLLRERRSRIFFLRKFFDYPISLSVQTLRNLGALRSVRIGFSYVRARLFPVRPETNLEEFFVNRFGRELYGTFFESYTEKVWGVKCRDISAEWGAQRVKGLSVGKAIAHVVSKAFRKNDVAQKKLETSLIERFLYPKLGPGQMWECVAEKVRAAGGEILHGREVRSVEVKDGRVVSVTTQRVGGEDAGAVETFRGDIFFSTMAVKDLVHAMGDAPPAPVREVASGLLYRAFVTVGLLLDELKVRDPADPAAKLVRDNWIYVQEPDVVVGRIQVFNNWSPWLVADPTKVWLGLEYFCDEGDALWSRTDADLIRLGEEELVRMGIADPGRVRDATVIRMPKTYPAYFGAYERFPEVRAWLDGIPNLWLVGRNGMHRYNNQDHSMLTAMTAVDQIVAGTTDREALWKVNAEQEYHEEK